MENVNIRSIEEKDTQPNIDNNGQLDDIVLSKRFEELLKETKNKTETNVNEFF